VLHSSDAFDSNTAMTAAAAAAFDADKSMREVIQFKCCNAMQYVAQALCSSVCVDWSSLQQRCI
jgi:hypothetical protein